MTPEEHELQLQMFLRLFEYIKILTDVLKSRNVVTEDDDLQAFRSAFHADDRNDALLQIVREEYAKIGISLGLTVLGQDS